MKVRLENSIGQQVAINVNVLPEDSFSGRITFIAPKKVMLI